MGQNPTAAHGLGAHQRRVAQIPPSWYNISPELDGNSDRKDTVLEQEGPPETSSCCQTLEPAWLAGLSSGSLGSSYLLSRPRGSFWHLCLREWCPLELSSAPALVSAHSCSVDPPQGQVGPRQLWQEGASRKLAHFEKQLPVTKLVYLTPRQYCVLHEQDMFILITILFWNYLIEGRTICLPTWGQNLAHCMYSGNDGGEHKAND